MRLSIADHRVFPYKPGTRQFDVSPVFFFGFVLRRGEVGVGFQEAFPVAVEQIQRPKACVAEQAILRRERCDRRFGVFIEETVVPDAEAECNVELRLPPR